MMFFEYILEDPDRKKIVVTLLRVLNKIYLRSARFTERLTARVRSAPIREKQPTVKSSGVLQKHSKCTVKQVWNLVEMLK